jgi:hypothetical protein
MAGFSWSYLLTSFTISKAADPTAFIVKAENKYGSIAPIISPAKTRALIMLISAGSPCFYLVWYALFKKAPYKDKLTKAADPMANPFPIAAVVLPAASKASVLSLV